MTQTIAPPIRWTIADLEVLAADEWKRYEIDDDITSPLLPGFCCRVQQFFA